jgi:hypothetical protein
MDSKLFDLEKRIIRLEAMLEAKEDLIDILTTVMRQPTVQPQPYVFPNQTTTVPVWSSSQGTSNTIVISGSCDGDLLYSGSGFDPAEWQVSCGANTVGKTHKPTGNQNTTFVETNPMRLDLAAPHGL